MIVSASLSQILELSQRMLLSAKGGDWEDVVRLEEERHHLIEQIFPLNPKAADADSDAAALREILAMDSQVAKLGVEAKEEARGILAKLQKGRRAAHAYQKTGTSRRA